MRANISYRFSENRSTFRSICKQAKFSNLVHRKPAFIHWKADAHKTSHCLMQILFKNHNWAIFLWKQAMDGRNVLGLCWTNFCWHRIVPTFVSIGRRYVPHSRSYTRCYAPWIFKHYQPQRWCKILHSLIPSLFPCPTLGAM